MLAETISKSERLRLCVDQDDGLKIKKSRMAKHLRILLADIVLIVSPRDWKAS